MSEKRKDNKGRILRTGESQRKDLIYQYRYKDIRGKRQTVYSSDLKELREKKRKSRSSSTMALIMRLEKSTSFNCWNATSASNRACATIPRLAITSC